MCGPLLRKIIKDSKKEEQDRGMCGEVLYDGVWYYENVLTLNRSRSLLGMLLSLRYKHIENPDKCRLQSQSYCLYGHAARVHKGSETDEYMNTVCSEVMSRLDSSVLAIAGPNPTAVCARGLYSMPGCMCQLCHQDCVGSIKRSKKYLSVLVSVQEHTTWWSCRLCELVSIRTCDVLVWRGDVGHGGGPYDKANWRFFFNILPRAECVDMSTRARYSTERISLYTCAHNRKVCIEGE